MKLYELDRETAFHITGEEEEGIFRLEKIDGMYSRCWDADDNLLHLVCYLEVTPYLPVNTS